MNKVHSKSEWWNLSRQRVVITGPTGFLGQNLIERFHDTEFLFIGRDHSIIEQISDFRPTLIFHFGAEIYNPDLMIDANILFTHKLLDAIKHLDFLAFIYCGSSSEYGKKDIPMSENHVLVPRTLYEATKGAGTLLCQAYATMYHKPIYIVRPFSVYGRHDRTHKFIPTLCRAFETQSPVMVSPGYHDWIYVDDFIDGVLAVSMTSNENHYGHIFNLGTGIQTSNEEVYNICCEVYGYSVPITHQQSLLRAYDSSHWVADIQKITQTYNFVPRYSLREGLEEMVYERSAS